MATVKKDELLRNHTTFRIGGPAKLFIVPETDEELAGAVAQHPNALVIGGGSNLLVADEGLDEVISMKNIKGFEILRQTGKAAISALAGSSFTALARKAQRAGLSGLEFAFGIPGTVGGAVRMNAGASGGEIKDCLETVTILHEGSFRELSAGELKLSYRSSSLPQGAIVTKAVFRLKEGGKDEILKKMKLANARRKKTQPLDVPSAGSVFKNPPGGHAGEIIDELGFKGMSVGGAQVSERHANFIVNTGQASARDVLELMRKIEEAVFDKKGIRFEREIKLAGSFGI